MLILLQHFPPPPPPNGFDLQSFVIETVDGEEIDYGKNNRLFRDLVRGNATLQGLRGFCDVWEGVVSEDPIITNLNKNNWKKMINFVNSRNGPPTCSGQVITLGMVCRKAYDYNNNFIYETRCAGQYGFLPIRRELYLFLTLSFLFILMSRNYYFKKKFSY